MPGRGVRTYRYGPRRGIGPGARARAVDVDHRTGRARSGSTRRPSSPATRSTVGSCSTSTPRRSAAGSRRCSRRCWPTRAGSASTPDGSSSKGTPSSSRSRNASTTGCTGCRVTAAPSAPPNARHYEETLHRNAAELRVHVRPGDFVLLHDPQTAALGPELASSGATRGVALPRRARPPERAQRARVGLPAPLSRSVSTRTSSRASTSRRPGSTAAGSR